MLAPPSRLDQARSDADCLQSAPKVSNKDSLIVSLHIRGSANETASRRARVVLPVQGGPVTIRTSG
jgi:hypothetical protein